jgi:hypothetical protein
VQDAINVVAPVGGTVCLEAGVYDVADGLTISQARSLRLTGVGPASVLVGRGTALTVERSFAVTVDRLAVVSGEAAPAAILLRGVVTAALEDLVVLSLAKGSAVALTGVALDVKLRGNVLVGGSGVQARALAAGLRVQDNLVFASGDGIDLGGAAAYAYDCTVARNDVFTGQGAGVLATGAVIPGGSLAVSDNRISSRGGGIAVGADAAVEGNTINGAGSDGIAVVRGAFDVAAGHVRVIGNRVQDRRGTGIALRTPVRTWLVKQNVLGVVGSGIAVEGRGGAEQVAIENNEVFDVATTEGFDDSAAGIAVTRAGSAAVLGNTVARVARGLREGRVRAGILVSGATTARVSGNAVSDIGPADDFIGIAAGALVLGPFGSLIAAENTIEGVAPPQQGAWHAILVGSAGGELVHVGAGKAVIGLANNRAVALTTGWAYLPEPGDDHVTLAANVLTGGGNQPTCLVRVRGDVVAEANQCTHAGRGDPVGIRLAAGTVTATSNRVRGPKSMLVLDVPENRFAAVANITADGTRLGSSSGSLPAPWAALNPNVP